MMNWICRQLDHPSQGPISNCRCGQFSYRMVSTFSDKRRRWNFPFQTRVIWDDWQAWYEEQQRKKNIEYSYYTSWPLLKE